MLAKEPNPYNQDIYDDEDYDYDFIDGDEIPSDNSRNNNTLNRVQQGQVQEQIVEPSAPIEQDLLLEYNGNIEAVAREYPPYNPEFDDTNQEPTIVVGIINQQEQQNGDGEEATTSEAFVPNHDINMIPNNHCNNNKKNGSKNDEEGTVATEISVDSNDGNLSNHQQHHQRHRRNEQQQRSGVRYHRVTSGRRRCRWFYAYLIPAAYASKHMAMKAYQKMKQINRKYQLTNGAQQAANRSARNIQTASNRVREWNNEHQISHRAGFAARQVGHASYMTAKSSGRAVRRAASSIDLHRHGHGHHYHIHYHDVSRKARRVAHHVGHASMHAAKRSAKCLKNRVKKLNEDHHIMDKTKLAVRQMSASVVHGSQSAAKSVMKFEKKHNLVRKSKNSMRTLGRAFSGRGQFSGRKDSPLWE